MDTSAPTEATLDEALAAAIGSKPEFAAWLLSRTPFAESGAHHSWTRSDHPWSRVMLTLQCVDSDGRQTARRECETDILVVYETSDGQRLALHIENKLAGGSFTKDQPELYRDRKDQWKGRPRLGNYHSAASVLVAPRNFYERHLEKSKVFDVYISHEELAEHLEEFKYCLRHDA